MTAVPGLELSPGVSDAGRPAAKRSLTVRGVSRYPSYSLPLCWLAPVFALLVLLVQPLGAYASAGVKTDVRCCCPSPEVCKCHDHDGRGDTTSMGRCAGGQHELAPELTTATLPDVPAAVVVDLPALAIEHAVLLLDEIFALPPEKPPF
jgi:hypothetical protein